ncbi:unnamed protein product [Eruca vesicaria subsp. sativa]|uniref:MATH domain-containing protein n=1 Tax=Eruca vesicaria subsp. sativa TaxID=29727 RepID=A0ABC8K2I5_ERUVS|nr:unnamed protein product [Eruca vesicaria subsp. sativa]
MTCGTTLPASRHLLAFPKRDKDGGGYFSLYLDLAPDSLPPGGQDCFDAENNSWVFEEFLPLSQVWGYLDDCRLTIIVDIDISLENPVNIIEPSLRFNQSDDASVSSSQADQVSRQVEQQTENPSNQDSDVALQEIQPVKETTDVNGFEVLSSQVESVKRIFERYPDIAVEFNAKNQHLRNACMNFLLSLIETLCQSLEKLSNEDLVEADIALTYLKDAGFKVEWLEKKLDQIKNKKEKEKSCLARLQEMDETLLKLKQMCSEVQTLAEEEKADLSAIRTALSFDALV